MSEELPKNYGFLKFIVIFMGVLIVLGLAVVVWKVIDLAKQKAAREKMEAAQQLQPTRAIEPLKDATMPFDFEILLESGERILETTAIPGGLWLRIGAGEKNERMILVDYSGKVIGKVKINKDYEEALPDQ